MINNENAVMLWLIRHHKDFKKYQSKLDVKHFKDPKNRIIFKKMCELEEWNMITFAMINELTTHVLSLEHNSDLVVTQHQIDIYVNDIHNDYTLKSIKADAKILIKDLTPDNASEIKEKLITQFNFKRNQSKSIADYLDLLDKYISNPTRRLKSPFNKLNEILNGGWFAGGVHTIAGRPGQGKTSLITSMIVNDLNLNRKVGFISLEMTSNEVLLRILSNLSSIELYRIENGLLNEKDIKRYAESYVKVGNSHLYINDNSIQTPQQIYNLVSKWVLEFGVEIVYIDQLSNINHEKAENKTNAVEKSMFWIKNTAKDNKIPVILVHQLNRDIDKKANPSQFSLSDLKDSSSIEADSYTVSFIVRPETYTSDIEFKGQKTKNLGIFKVAKNRGGIMNEVYLDFQGEFYRFTERESQEAKNDINQF